MMANENSSSPRLMKHFAKIRKLAGLLRDVFVATERDGEAVSEHIDFSVEGMLTAGACEAAIEQMDKIIEIFGGPE